jgi:hypothetical protein
MYPDMAEAARRHGYALAVHGSLARDFDVIAIPWVESPSPHEDFIAELESRFAFKRIGVPTVKPHGRMAYTISIGFGHCFVDLQFMPTRDT